ncbi:SPOR domain-containing protein [Thiothrix litoralis]|uniref:SPOR domain-containing protein n=1 Tax=Thiothrix litoralis TaxID=2891210 RepID=A0ABX7WPR0_9GAMM|nr:SPOR domain-containing protein [Thiothrix litoralis]QTR45171.1 SPOR domain-containing protein [Thiothrix litoralis]
MTKDFKKQSTADSAFGQYGLGWMVGGVAIGLLIGAGMYALANKGNAPDASATTQASLSTSEAATADMDTVLVGNNAAISLQDSPPAGNEPLEESPGFSYHAVLPQLEVDVPLAPQVEQAPATKTSKATDKKLEVTAAQDKVSDKKAAASVMPTGFNGYQIGSYKTPDQAANMQGRLKKKGLSSRVEQASVQGATWYRVRIGPATSLEMLQKWQQTLSGMGISPMAVRM